MNKKILECSSKGDKKFSALYVKISVNNVLDTIENHYQKAKVFKDENNELTQYKDWKMAKGKKPVAFKISEYYLPLKFGKMFYNMMWYKYLKNNPSLIKILEDYDDYNDIFKTKDTVVCQSDVIREFMQDELGNKYSESERGKKVFQSCKELNELLLKKNTVIIENDDIFNGYPHIIGHQVNCQGVMGGGIAKTVKEKYFNAFTEYKNFLNEKEKNYLALGTCQIVKFKDKSIANLYGQLYCGNDKNIVYTSYLDLRKALTSLKNIAKENNLIVSLPYNIGCDLANGDWENEVYPIIKEVFSDYYVILYKFNPLYNKILN